jgi:hypothetical protein
LIGGPIVPEFILLMHADTVRAELVGDWKPYLGTLRRSGALRGGSAIGEGVCVRKDGPAAALSRQLTGFIRVEASDMEAAKLLLAGNPVYAAGGTVEIRHLPETE